MKRIIYIGWPRWFSRGILLACYVHKNGLLLNILLGKLFETHTWGCALYYLISVVIVRTRKYVY